MNDEEILDDLPEDDIPENDTPEVDAEEAPEPDPTPEPEAPAAPQATVWDAFKALPDFQGMQDDRAIAQRLYQALEREKHASHALAQYQQTMPVVQQYLQNRGPFEQWLASRNQPAPQPQAQQPQQPAEEKWWNPPELRDAYKRYIVKDENGRDAIHPDTPLDARHAINEHFAYKQQFADKFLTNPEEALAPMVARLAQQQAEQIVSSKLEHAGRVQYVSNLEEQNRDWLFDQSGNVSPEGEAARNYIEQAKSLGIASPEQRWDFALQMVERDLLRQVRHAQERQAHQQVFQSHLETAAQPQAAAPAPAPVPQQSQAEANMDYLRRAASRTANRAGASTNSPEMARRGMTFEEQLRHTLEDRGLV
jgi:hypothetical protein